VVPEPLKEASDQNASNAEILSSAVALQSFRPGTILARTSGQSMEPAFHDGWILLIMPTQWEDLQVGQVVAYKNRQGVLIVHRLTHSYGESWLIQGDNNPVPDAEQVTRKNLVGVIYGSIPSSALKEN
jgi:signal peptidase I